MNDLATCPYCLEPIQRLASRCKHCHASLTGTGQPHVEGYGTVGGAGGISIGGQGHHIEGGIHLTLAELDGVDEATKCQLRLKYESRVRNFPEQAQYHFALGLSYLDQRLYDLSLTSLKRALGKTAHDSDLLYYIALAQVGGKRPRILKLAAVREIESYLETAIRLDSEQFHYKLLLAAVKFDYYQCNGLRIPPPNVEQLLLDAQRNKPNPKEIRLLGSHISLPEGPPLSLIRQF